MERDHAGSHRNRLKPLIAIYGGLPIKMHIDDLMERLQMGDIPRPGGKKRRPSNGSPVTTYSA